MTEKGYEIRIEERDGYLYVWFCAEVNRLDIVIDYGNDIANAVRRTGQTNVLFENHAPILFDRQAYQIASAALRNSIQGPARIAVLDQYSNNTNYFAAATEAARSVGLDARYFDTTESAESWLRSGSESKL